eukprot:4891264-Prymnesium_polylepis.2
MAFRLAHLAHVSAHMADRARIFRSAAQRIHPRACLEQHRNSRHVPTHRCQQERRLHIDRAPCLSVRRRFGVEQQLKALDTTRHSVQHR